MNNVKSSIIGIQVDHQKNNNNKNLILKFNLFSMAGSIMSGYYSTIN